MSFFSKVKHMSRFYRQFKKIQKKKKKNEGLDTNQRTLRPWKLDMLSLGLGLNGSKWEINAQHKVFSCWLGEKH